MGEIDRNVGMRVGTGLVAKVVVHHKTYKYIIISLHHRARNNAGTTVFYATSCYVIG